MGDGRGDPGGGWGWGDFFTGVAVGWLLAPRRDRAAARPTYEPLGGTSDPEVPWPVWGAIFLCCSAVGVGYGWSHPEAGFWDSVVAGLVGGFLVSPFLILLGGVALFPVLVVWASVREIREVARESRARPPRPVPLPNPPRRVLGAGFAAVDAKAQTLRPRPPRGRWNQAVADELERLSPIARLILLGGPWWSLLAVAVFITQAPAEWSGASLLFHGALLLSILIVLLGMPVILARIVWGLVARRRSGRRPVA